MVDVFAWTSRNYGLKILDQEGGELAGFEDIDFGVKGVVFGE